MIINPSLPSGYAVFCDDIRHEIGGKRSHIGIYANYLFINEIPALLSKLCVSVNYREETHSNKNVKINILYEIDGNDETLIEMRYEVPEVAVIKKSKDFKMRSGIFEFSLSPFEIKAEGKLKVRVFRGEDEIRLGALIIAKRNPDEGDNIEQWNVGDIKPDL